MSNETISKYKVVSVQGESTFVLADYVRVTSEGRLEFETAGGVVAIFQDHAWAWFGRLGVLEPEAREQIERTGETDPVC